MAGKEATIYIVDLGVTMGECHNGRMESDLDYGMRYIWGKITKTMSANRKGWSVGVIGFRTDETNNKMADNGEEEGYEHISNLKPLGEMLMPDLRNLQQSITTSETHDGDALSAVALALEAIEDFTKLKTGKRGKFTRRIVLMTDGEASIDSTDSAAIVERLNELEFEFAVV